MLRAANEGNNRPASDMRDAVIFRRCELEFISARMKANWVSVSDQPSNTMLQPTRQPSKSRADKAVLTLRQASTIN